MPICTVKMVSAFESICLFAQRMLIFLRSLFGTGRRAFYSRVLLSSTRSHNNCVYSCSLNVSQLASPIPYAFLSWITGFLCFSRYPFSSKASLGNFSEVFDRQLICEIVREQKWDDFRIISLFNSALTPRRWARKFWRTCRETRP